MPVRLPSGSAIAKGGRKGTDLVGPKGVVEAVDVASDHLTGVDTADLQGAVSISV